MSTRTRHRPRSSMTPMQQTPTPAQFRRHHLQPERHRRRTAEHQCRDRRSSTESPRQTSRPRDQYLFNVVATQGATATTQGVTLSINDLNEGFPTLGSELLNGSWLNAEGARPYRPGDDPQRDPLTYTITALPAQGTVFLNGSRSRQSGADRSPIPRLRSRRQKNCARR